MGVRLNALFNFLAKFARIFVWWTKVAPWEQVIRVRLGKHTKNLRGGVHLCIPYVDDIYRQNMRLRTAEMGVQTLSTRDGKTLTLSGTISYKINDMTQLYNTLHHAEDTLRFMAQSEIAEYVFAHDLLECTPRAIEDAVSAKVDLKKYGLESAGVRLIDFAVVRTYRLLMDTKGYSHGDVLNTSFRDNANSGGPQ